jgi:hypothetical protein
MRLRPATAMLRALPATAAGTALTVPLVLVLVLALEHVARQREGPRVDAARFMASWLDALA